MGKEVYQSGQTVRLSCEFNNFKGEPVDPEIVKVIIYDEKYNKITDYSLGANSKTDVGKYFFDYKTDPNKEQRVYYEWYGEINGNPALKRSSFRTNWI